MSCVSDEPRGPSRHLNGARWICAIVVLALVVGPGFFAAALLNALYRDMPPASAQSAVEIVPSTRHVHHNSGGRLSPISQRVAPRVKASSAKTRLERASSNPVKAYLKLTGSSDFTAMPASTNEAQVKGTDTTYRAVCVRLCDGAYFPISETASSDQLAENAAQCQSSCAAPSRLYVYAKDRETPMQMRDLSGNSYLELETAFRFHTTYDAQCTCRAQPWTLASRNLHRRYADLEDKKLAAGHSLPKAAVALQVSPSEFSTVADASNLREVAGNQSGRARTSFAKRSKSSSFPTLKTRFATPAQVAGLDAEQARSKRLVAVAARADLLATLDLPKLRSARRPVRVAAAERPQAPGTPSFLTLDPAAYEPQTAPQSVTVAKLTGPAGRKIQRTATDILMHNLNPQF